MAQPITWQNVNQGDVATAWRGLDSAQRSINGAFDGLSGLVKDREAIDAGNQVIQGKNNTNSYLDQVAELGKTPEALQAKIADGSLDRLRASFGPNIDHAATRNAATDLLDQRYKQVQAATEYTHAMADERSHPFMQAYKVASLNGDKEGMAKADAAYAAAGGRDLAGLVGFADQRTQQLTERGYAANTDSRAGTMQAATIKNMEGTLANQRNQTEISRGQLGVAQQEAALRGKQFNMALQDHLDQREAKAVEALGKSRQADAGTLEGQTAVLASIESAFKGDESGATNARKAFTDIVKKFPGITTQDAMLAVMGQDNSRYLKNDAWVRSNTVDRAGEFAKSPESILRAQAASLQRDATIDVYSRAHQAALAGPMSTGPAPTRNAAKLAEAAKSVQVVPNPVAIPSPVAAQEAALRTQAAIPAPGIDSVVLPSSIEGGSAKVGEYPAFSRTLKANVNAEALKAKQAEIDAQAAKEAKLKAELKAYKKLRPYGSND